MTRIAYRTPQTTNQECDALDMQQDRREISSRINIGKEVWYLTQEEVIAAGVTEQDILRLTLADLVAHGRKEYEMPAKIGVHPHQEVFFHAMPAYVPGRLALGMKWIECYPNNPGKFNLPQTTGLLILNDPLSGCPIAIMDCVWITAMRTPAVTVLSAGGRSRGTNFRHVRVRRAGGGAR